LVNKLLALFRDPNHDLDQVVQLIGYDPSLTVQLLRTCNSACFAGEQHTGDIFDAVTRMGLYQVYCLVVGIYGAQARAMPGADQGVDVKELWRHSVAAAVAASVVAGKTGQERTSAFTAGLLHDIGKLVLASTQRGNYAKVCRRAKEEGVALSAVERSAFAIDHAELGGELLRRWELPAEIVTPVRFHHDLQASAPHETLTAVVQVGDMLAHQLFGEDLAKSDMLGAAPDALETLALSPDELPRLLAAAQTELASVNGMLEM
jgi:putative nucleotidyltransferase with HDIG domain